MAAPPPPVASDVATELPPVIRNKIAHLEKWASDNEADARKQSVLFWSLKLPAILSAGAAASSGAIEAFDGLASLLAGLAGAFVVIDGFASPGRLRTAYRRASYELRQLQTTLSDEYQAAILREPDIDRHDAISADVLTSASAEEVRINENLKNAEGLVPKR